MHLEFLKDNAIPATGSSLPSRLPFPSPESLSAPSSPTQQEIIPRLSHHIDLSSSSFRPGLMLVVISTSSFFFVLSCLLGVRHLLLRPSVARKDLQPSCLQHYSSPTPNLQILPGDRGLELRAAVSIFCQFFPGLRSGDKGVTFL